MKRIALLITCIALVCANANAQSLLERLGKRARNATEQSIGNMVEKGVNDVLDGKADKKGQAGASASQGKAAPGSVPNPYTAFDIPENPFDVALGLPENQDSAEPALVVPSSKQSYAAFTYGGDGLRGKEFWNAERQRLFTVTFQKVNGEKIVDRSLTIVDSMAVYTIIDEEKLIIKMPLASIKSAAMHNVVKNEEVFSKNQLSTSQGRWCYKSAGGSVTTTKQGDREITEENSEASFYDLETGIVLEVKHGFGHDYTRNIHLGVFYPEIFDLPADYKMVVQNVAGGAQQWDAMNQKSQQMQDRVNQMGLENMSLEELMRRAK